MRRESPQSAADALSQLPAGTKFLVAFEQTSPDLAALKSLGFVRVIATIGRSILLRSDANAVPTLDSIYIVADRLAAGSNPQRIRESLEAAFGHGNGQAIIFADLAEPPLLGPKNARTTVSIGQSNMASV